MTAQENTSPVAEKTKVSCAKKCSKSCAAKAEKAAVMDDMIEKRVCDKSGKVSYHKKAVCEVSGKVSYTEVQYDEASAQFVDLKDVSSGKKACCAKGKKKGCCAKKASAMSDSAEKAAAEPTEGTK